MVMAKITWGASPLGLGAWVLSGFTGLDFYIGRGWKGYPVGHKSFGSLWTAEPFVAAREPRVLHHQCSWEALQRACYPSFAHTSTCKTETPSGRSPFPFQEHGARVLAEWKRVLLGDEPGVGKTTQAIIACQLLEKKPKRILVICPAGLKQNWRREIELCSSLDYPVEVDEASPLFLRSGLWLVTNYDRIITDGGKWIRDAQWDVVICDEAHKLKNPDAQRTFFILGDRHNPGIARKAPVFFALTGTPLTGDPTDMLPILTALDNTRWVEPHFKNEFLSNYINGRPVKGKHHAPKDLDKLHVMLRCPGPGGMVRRTKKQVLKDLPPKLRRWTPVETAGGKVRRSKYESILAGLDRESALAALEAARQGADVSDQITLSVSKGVSLFDLAGARKESGAAKVGACVERALDLLESGKLVIFGYHKESLSIVKSALESKGVTCVMLNGDTPMGARQPMVDRFQTDPECKVFIGNIEAAGVGFTLTSSCQVLFLEMDWTPALNEQAEDRCARLGQKETVLVEYLVSDDGIDGRIAAAIRRKSKWAQDALDGGVVAKAVTTSEWSHAMRKLALAAKDGDIFCQTLAESIKSDDNVVRAVLNLVLAAASGR